MSDTPNTPDPKWQTPELSDTPRTDKAVALIDEHGDDLVRAAFARSLERELAERLRDVNALMEDIRKGDNMLMAWFKAASPYATPGSLESGLDRLRSCESALMDLYEANAKGVFAVPDEHYGLITQAAEALRGDQREPAQRTIQCLCPKCGVKHGGLSEAQ